MDEQTPYLLLLLVILLAFSSFFSSTETAVASINRIRLKNMAAQGNKKAAHVLAITADFDRVLSAILIGNNLVNISAATIGTILFTHWFGTSGAGISTVVLTFIILLFGEILPKSYAKIHADLFLLRVVGLLHFFMLLFSPVIHLLLKATRLFARKSRHQTAGHPMVTEQELKYLIEESHNEGVLEEQESDLVQSALDFDETTVDEILTPRVDVVAIHESTPVEQVKERFLEDGYSRLPIYHETIDRIVGVLYFKDFFNAYLKHRNELEITSIMQPVICVPPKKPISELMKELQRQKIHMAVVSDQYGGTIGIITLEDVLEELVGEIWDESDQEEPDVIELRPGTYQVTGTCNPEDFLHQVGITYAEQDLERLPNSFSGWALESFERIPMVGEQFVDQNLAITVSELMDQRITALIVEILPPGTKRPKDHELPTPPAS